jgi:hypothetical protein
MSGPSPVNPTTITSPDGAASLIGSAFIAASTKPVQQGPGEAGDARCVNQTCRNIVIPRNLRRTRSLRKGRRNDPAPVCTESSNPDVVVMKSAKEGV